MGTSIALFLLSLLGGTFLLFYVDKLTDGEISETKGRKCQKCKNFGNYVAYFVIIVSLLGILCSSWSAYRHHCRGYVSKHECSATSKSCPLKGKSN